MDRTPNRTDDEGRTPDATADNLAPDERAPEDPGNTQLDADPDLKREEDR